MTPIMAKRNWKFDDVNKAVPKPQHLFQNILAAGICVEQHFICIVLICTGTEKPRTLSHKKTGDGSICLSCIRWYAN